MEPIIGLSPNTPTIDARALAILARAKAHSAITEVLELADGHTSLTGVLRTYERLRLDLLARLVPDEINGTEGSVALDAEAYAQIAAPLASLNYLAEQALAMSRDMATDAYNLLSKISPLIKTAVGRDDFPTIQLPPLVEILGFEPGSA